MAVTLKRQLTDEEKARVLQIHGRKCFATGHEIPDGEQVQFDHIHAYALGGASELDNIAPMCTKHNKQKGIYPLADFRVRLRLDQFFGTGDKLTLRDLLGFLKKEGDLAEYGQPVTIHTDGGTVTVESADDKLSLALYTCPTTKWQYFYATLPVSLLDSDDDEKESIGLQPRYLIPDKVFRMYQHFQYNPVLQPSVGRIVDNRIRLFDGQHKAAALLWCGRGAFECKVYISHDANVLNQTNIAAHDKFAQTRFYSSIMVLKLGTQFGADFERYKNRDDEGKKSEAGFMAFLAREGSQRLSRGERNQRFRSYLYNSVLDDEQNKLSQFVSPSNRSTDEKPLTIDMLSKSLFSCFVHREPVEDDLASARYKRDAETQNMLFLMNALYDLAMSGWNSKAGPKDSCQRKLTRLFRSKSIMAWSELLRDAVCGKLDLQDAEDRQRPFYRDLDDSGSARVRSVVERLVGWKLWDAPEGSDIDRVLADKKSAVKDWLRENGLTTGYLMGAPE